MRKMFITVFLSFVFFYSNAQTQVEINATAATEYKKADKELNTVYTKILNDYKSDITFIKNLKASQRLWIQFRDAELKVKYPDRPAGYYGSVLPTCKADYLTQLTNDRTKVLQVWIDGVPEGDACAGSVKRQ